ncbi:MAG TPA: YdbL family protein [Fontimonas sp.]
MFSLRTGLLGPLLPAILVLAACASTPLAFPTAEAESLADRSIAQIWATGAELTPPPSLEPPLLDAASLEINRLKTQMARRHGDLRPLFDRGTIGLTADGYVDVHDITALAEEARNPVRAIVANENADRAALYREIATANEQKRWAGEIRDAFANRWIAQARSGWWYQDANGGWKQK